MRLRVQISKGKGKFTSGLAKVKENVAINFCPASYILSLLSDEREKLIRCAENSPHEIPELFKMNPLYVQRGAKRAPRAWGESLKR